jgi:hypothetical protein
MNTKDLLKQAYVYKEAGFFSDVWNKGLGTGFKNLGNDAMNYAKGWGQDLGNAAYSAMRSHDSLDYKNPMNYIPGGSALTSGFNFAKNLMGNRAKRTGVSNLKSQNQMGALPGASNTAGLRSLGKPAQGQGVYTGYQSKGFGGTNPTSVGAKPLGGTQSFSNGGVLEGLQNSGVQF